MNAKEIATTIRDQIAAPGVQIMWSWGAKEFVALPEVKQLDGRLQLGGLQFRVNGRLFKGIVMVSLMGNDTYTVRFCKMYKGRLNCKKVYEEVFCDQLTEIIDRFVETPLALPDENPMDDFNYVGSKKRQT